VSEPIRGEVRLQIQAQADRRTVAAILADNGFTVRIEKEKPDTFDWEYFLVISAETGEAK